MGQFGGSADHSWAQHFGQVFQWHLGEEEEMTYYPFPLMYLILLCLFGHFLPMGAQEGQSVPVWNRQRFDGFPQLCLLPTGPRIVELFE